MAHDTSSCAELNQVDAPECREDLILAADRFVQHIALEAYGFLREIKTAQTLTLERMQRVEQADDERRRASEAGESREFRRVVHLDVTREAACPEAFTERSVLDLVDILYALDLSVCDAD